MKAKLIKKWKREMDEFHSKVCEIQIQIAAGHFGPTTTVQKAAEAAYYAARALQIESMLIDIEEKENES